ncbi:HAD family hydrolase [Actinoplanes bogorensis]|uniref:HAD family hydrolase n=1 Tax=Paractinoplanes bogorensis TaxID=1610840 RepID=A0ABS5YPT6_9ACTN|nr:HAD family hydrolase [Actinoplanes bogorensis]MBU2665477.1 HAD family hydrolase [Actinoplanes bogorensis]
MYKAILLDVFGTLVVDDDGPYIAELAAIAGVSPAQLEQEWNASLWAMADGAHGPAFRTLADLNASSLAEAFPVRLPARPFGPPELFPDAVPFLAALDVPVCLVSDADRAPLTAILETLNITVDHVVTSEDARAYKPRPEPFRMALARLGLGPADVIHVGDSPASDLVGAAAMGIATAFVNRAGRPAPDGVHPTRTVSRLTDLLPYLTAR